MLQAIRNPSKGERMLATPPQPLGVVKAAYQTSARSRQRKAPRDGGAEVNGDMKKGPTGQGPNPQRLSQILMWIATLAQVSLFYGGAMDFFW